MNIIDAIKDRNLFRPFLGEDLTTWHNWMAALRVLYGLPFTKAGRKLAEQCTGRTEFPPPGRGFDTALYLIGRRSGKSRTSAIIGAYSAALAGAERKLAKGEHGVVAVVAPTRRQSQIVKQYLRAIFEAPLLAGEVIAETNTGFTLTHRICIEILTGDFRTARGFTLLACIVDEIAFFGIDEEVRVKSDTELIRAIKPSLATTKGKLICIGSPYAKRGWTYQTYKKHFGNNAGRTLVWNCPSRTMNPTLPQSVVDEAIAEDMQAAKSEYLGEFRDDVGEFLPRDVIERLVVPGRVELLPQPDRKYQAFVDVSGGRGDDAALAVAHRDRERRTVVLDLLKRWKPPFSPQTVINEMAEHLRRYNLRRVTGDNYAAEFVCRAFESSGLKYTKAEKPKSQLYAELLPRMCSGEIELLDHPILITQLAGLERRTRSGGKDIIDHPSGGHDDVANAVAGVAEVCSIRQTVCGAL